MPEQHVQLTPKDRDTLTALITKGNRNARIYKRALGLLELDRGKTYVQVGQTLDVTGQTLSRWAKQYRTLGLSQRCPAAGPAGGDDRKTTRPNHRLGLFTSPAGHGRWTLRLLADQCVELGYCEHLSHTHVQTILKKTT